MTKTNHSSERKGRPKVSDYLKLRGKAFEMIWEKWRNESFGSLINYEEAEEVLGVHPKSVRAIFRDIKDISPEIALDADGVRVGRPTYYHSSCRTAGEWKSAISDRCVELIPPYITLACGPGSTVVYNIRRLIQEGRYNAIVTNNAGIIDHVGGKEISNLFFVGGEYNARIHGCVGNSAVEGFRSVTCKAALAGISGINEKGDLFVRHSDEVPVVSAMIQSVSKYVFIVADVRKLIQVDAWKFINIPQLLEKKPNLEVHLVTNPCEFLKKDEDIKRARRVAKALEEMKVKVEWAPAKSLSVKEKRQLSD